MRRILPVLLLVAACHAQEPRTGGIDSVAVVLVGADEPLPFDPRGSRITVVTHQIAELVGHPVILELDTALSPELKVSLEESVLASFENVARELVWLQKQDPETFAAAQKIERVRCRYDAVAEKSTSRLLGSVLEVRSPPERFPLLERDLLVSAVYDQHVDALERRWGKADPTKLDAHDQASWFTYMTMTRPGYGYLWMHARVVDHRTPAGLRAEHLARILKLAAVVTRRSPLDERVTTFLVDEGSWIATAHDADAGVAAEYAAWLERSVPLLNDASRKKVADLLWSREHNPPPLPGFDRVAFGLGFYDRAGASVPPGFFAAAYRDPAQAERLAARIASGRDERLLDLALRNLDSGEHAGEEAVALLERIKDPQLFHHGFRVLFDDQARQDSVRAALETAAFRWWRDAPSRRGMAILVLARKNEDLDPHYGDGQWERLAPELGGPLKADVLAAYLAEGPRAVEMAPKIWKGLARSGERDGLVARSLPMLLDRDVEARTSRARPALVLLRKRHCDEKNAAGFAALRDVLQRWAAQHPNDARMVANAITDATLGRCAVADDDKL